MNGTFLKSFQDTIIGEEYLTTPYDYTLHQSGFYENIKNQFLPVTTLLELQKTLPIYANTLIQVFTIPVKIIDNNGKKLIDIEPEYISQIRKNTTQDIEELFSAIPTNMDILKGDIYELIEDLNKCFVDENDASQEEISIQINTFYNKIKSILEEDLTAEYNLYKAQFDKEYKEGDIFSDNPLEIQVEKVKTLVINFMEFFSKEDIISMNIEDGSSILFNIVNSAQLYLSQRYNNSEDNNSQEEKLKSYIKDKINELNFIFNKNNDEEKIEFIDDRVISLSENIFNYLSLLRVEPKTIDEIHFINKKINNFFVNFCKQAYGENALKKGLLLGEAFGNIKELIEDFLIVKEYPYENINPDTALGMCISILDYHDRGKKKKILKILEEIKTRCNINDITKELYHKDIIILKEIAQQYEIYEFSAILKKIEPKI